MIRRVSVALLVLLALVACSEVNPRPEPTIAVQGNGCNARNNNTYSKLLECVSVDGVLKHQTAFQAIANANKDLYYPGSRAAGTEGYAKSVDYVARLLRKAGYTVTLDPFEFTFDFPALLEQISPISADYPTGAFTGSGFGDVEGAVIPVDINLTGDRSTSSGCEETDFSGLDFSGSNDIALIQRGGPPAPAPTCTFALKVQNARDAGAEAVIIFNQGNAPTREGLIVGTLAPYSADIPVVGASFAAGTALAQPGSTAHIRVIESEPRTDYNVIAELPGVNQDNVVMAGAHLDSVEAGPGINDNGSGSAAILEVALNLAKLKPQNTLRFAWWGAEELGLVGSTAYVNELSAAERARIALYLNFDMVGSPNFIYMVYDADQSSFTAPVTVPDGSIAIEDVFESYYTYANVPYDDTAFSGRSDYQAFINNGIPSSGLFTGAEGVKTPAQAAIWGGTAGTQYDPCYHLVCDTLANLANEALDTNSDAIAFAVMTFAYSTQGVNGVAGKAVPGGFVLPEPAGPEGTFGNPGGGGLDHDHDLAPH